MAGRPPLPRIYAQMPKLFAALRASHIHAPLVEVSPKKEQDMNFSIREATQGDYEGLCDVFAEVDTLHRKALPHVFREPDGPARTKEYISGLIANEDVSLFVAEREGQIIGLVQTIIRQAPDIPIMVARQYAMIGDLVVRKRFRRSGVGQSLVEGAHQWALDKGVAQVELSVWEFNKEAIAFYEKLGYRTASRRMWNFLK